ncbi:MAG: NINE protein [Eubacteriaceae bacterium]|nr:NINE protein [Eubacteriaceae bacterium]
MLVCTVFGHKFYEEKIGMGILYIFTGGLFGIGWLIDLIKIATGPETYYVQ